MESFFEFVPEFDHLHSLALKKQKAHIFINVGEKKRNNRIR